MSNRAGCLFKQRQPINPFNMSSAGIVEDLDSGVV